MIKIAFSLLILTLVGCASGAPPSGIERAFYQVTTNWVTNVFNVVQVNPTNNVVTNTVFVTNVVATYHLDPKPEIVDVAQTVGVAASSAGAPWAGAAGTVVALVLWIWAQIRNRKIQTVAETFAQGIETAREVIKAQPNGPAIDYELKAQLKSQQVKAGVKEESAKIVENKVDEAAAAESAKKVARETIVSPTP